MVFGAVFRLRVNISWFCFVSPPAVSRRRGGGDFLPIILWEQILLTEWRQYCHQGGDRRVVEEEDQREERLMAGGQDLV